MEGKRVAGHSFEYITKMSSSRLVSVFIQSHDEDVDQVYCFPQEMTQEVEAGKTRKRNEEDDDSCCWFKFGSSWKTSGLSSWRCGGWCLSLLSSTGKQKGDTQKNQDIIQGWHFRRKQSLVNNWFTLGIKIKSCRVKMKESENVLLLRQLSRNWLLCLTVSCFWFSAVLCCVEVSCLEKQSPVQEWNDERRLCLECALNLCSPQTLEKHRCSCHLFSPSKLYQKVFWDQESGNQVNASIAIPFVTWHENGMKEEMNHEIEGVTRISLQWWTGWEGNKKGRNNFLNLTRKKGESEWERILWERKNEIWKKEA